MRSKLGQLTNNQICCSLRARILSTTVMPSLLSLLKWSTKQHKYVQSIERFHLSFFTPSPFPLQTCATAGFLFFPFSSSSCHLFQPFDLSLVSNYVFALCFLFLFFPTSLVSNYVFALCFLFLFFTTSCFFCAYFGCFYYTSHTKCKFA